MILGGGGVPRGPNWTRDTGTRLDDHEKQVYDVCVCWGGGHPLSWGGVTLGLDWTGRTGRTGLTWSPLPSSPLPCAPCPPSLSRASRAWSCRTPSPRRTWARAPRATRPLPPAHTPTRLRKKNKNKGASGRREGGGALLLFPCMKEPQRKNNENPETLTPRRAETAGEGVLITSQFDTRRNEKQGRRHFVSRRSIRKKPRGKLIGYIPHTNQLESTLNMPRCLHRGTVSTKTLACVCTLH